MILESSNEGRTCSPFSADWALAISVDPNDISGTAQFAIVLLRAHRPFEEAPYRRWVTVDQVDFSTPLEDVSAKDIESAKDSLLRGNLADGVDRVDDLIPTH